MKIKFIWTSAAVLYKLVVQADIDTTCGPSGYEKNN